MMQAYPSPITQENFLDAWRYVDRIRRIAKKKRVTGAIAAFFSNLIFILLVFFTGNGLIYHHIPGKYRDFLASIHYFSSTWDAAAQVILKPFENGLVQLATVVLIDFAVPLAFTAAIVLLTALLYHPLPKKAPGQSPKENAQLLLDAARKAKAYADNHYTASVAWCFLFVVMAFIAFIGYLIYTDELADVYTIYSDILTPNGLCNIMIVSMGLYLGISALDTVMILITRMLYRYRIPYSIVADAEAYYCFSDEDRTGLTEEEILAGRLASAAQKRTEALELERMKAYHRANALLLEAAHGGDPDAMDHYARHCLIAFRKEAAMYWLQKCLATGDAKLSVTRIYNRLKWHLKVTAHYLPEQEASV